MSQGKAGTLTFGLDVLGDACSEAILRNWPSSFDAALKKSSVPASASVITIADCLLELGRDGFYGWLEDFGQPFGKINFRKSSPTPCGNQGPGSFVGLPWRSDMSQQDNSDQLPRIFDRASLRPEFLHQRRFVPKSVEL